MATQLSTQPLLYVLGKPRVVVQDEEIPIPATKRNTVVLYLATRNHADKAIRRETLASYFNFSNPKSLKTSLSRVRNSELWYRTLIESGCVEMPKGGAEVKFNPLTDYALFSQELKHLHNTADSCKQQLNICNAAIAWLQGGFLEGYDLADGGEAHQDLLEKRQYIKEQWKMLVTKIAPLLDADGQHHVALLLLEDFFERYQEKEHEDIVIDIMKRAAVFKQRERVFDAFHKHEKALQKLGIEQPSAQVLELKKAIENNSFIAPLSLQPQEKLSIGSTTNNLPLSSDGFIERDEVIASLSTFLRTKQRLITIVGIGGVGKTRIATEISHQYSNRFTDGIIFISLSDTPDMQEIWQCIASEANITLIADLDPLLTIIAMLQEKNILLLFDNAETAPDNFASNVEKLLQSTLLLKVLVTSRQQLANRHTPYLLKQEQQIQLSGMTLEEGLELFLDRTNLEALESEGYGHFQKIHEAVAGMPLALEIIAGMYQQGRIKALKQEVQQSVAELGVYDHNHRFNRIFETSFAQLSPELQQKYCQLSVFQGDFTPTDSEVLFAVTTIQLMQYQQRSLLILTQQGHYTLHPVLRDLTKKRLEAYANYTKIYARYACYYLAQLNDKETSQQAHLFLSLGNIKAALQWLEHSPINELQPNYYGITVTIDTLISYAAIANSYEMTTQAEQLLRKALAKSGLSHQQRALASFRLAQSIRGQDAKEERLRCQEAWQFVADEAEDSLIKAEILSHWGLVLKDFDLEEAKEKLELSKQIYEAIISNSEHAISEQKQERTGYGKLLRSLSFIVYEYQKSPDDAITLLHNSLDTFTQLEDKPQQAKTLTNLGIIYGITEQVPKAEKCLEQAMDLYYSDNEAKHRHGIALVVNNLAMLHKTQGNDTLALEGFHHLVKICKQTGHLSHLGLAFMNISDIYIKQDRLNEAEQFLHKALKTSYLSSNPVRVCHTLICYVKWLIKTKQVDEARHIAQLIYTNSNIQNHARAELKKIFNELSIHPPTTTTQTTDLQSLAKKIISGSRA